MGVVCGIACDLCAPCSPFDPISESLSHLHSTLLHSVRVWVSPVVSAVVLCLRAHFRGSKVNDPEIWQGF